MNAEPERGPAPKTFGFFVQIVFFVLTCAALFAAHELFGGIVTGVAALALAEYLMRARRWLRTGVESALWIGGLFALISELPHSGKPEALLVIAAAAALAGARVRNPLFGALAAGLTMHYFESKWDLGVLAALVMATLALVLLCRTWRRSSTEWLFIAIAVILPLAGWAEADRQWRFTTIALYAAFGVLAFALAIAKRHHAFFLAAAIGFTVAAVELAREIPIVLEAKLAIAGAFLLSLSLVVSRLLRDRTRGFVTTKESLTKADELLEIAATIAIQPPHPQPQSPNPGGGSFGGAGASGNF